MDKKFRGFWLDVGTIQMDLPAVEKVLLCFLKGFGKKGCDMTNKKIGEVLGMTENGVSSALKRLRKRGLVTTVREGWHRFIFIKEQQ